MDNLERFIKMQNEDYSIALAEIKKGKKDSHWIWYIFPQISGLGQSFMCKKYDIRNLDEAIDFLKNQYLRDHLCEISQALLKLKTNNIKSVMYYPDNLKLQSSMTLFKKADEKLKNSFNNVFQNVLDKFYDGKDDIKTLEILEEIEKNKKKFIIREEKNEKNSLDDGKNYKITKYFHVEDKDKKEDKKDKIDEKKEYKGNNETKEKISAKKEDENEGKKAANKDDKKEENQEEKQDNKKEDIIDDKKEENIEDIKNVKKEKKKKEEKQEEKQDNKKEDKKDNKKDNEKDNKKDNEKDNKKDNKNKETKKQ